MNGRLSPRVLITAIAVIAVMGGAIGFAALAWRDRQATIGEAERSLRGMAQLMEEHTRAALLANRLQLDRLADHIGSRPLNGLTEEDRILAKEVVGAVPHGHSIWILDENGDLAQTSVDLPRRQINFADRKFFSELRDTGAETYISSLLWGRLTGGHVITNSRRLRHADGTFKGVIGLSVSADYFLNFYASLMTEDMVFAVVKWDGGVVVRHPLPAHEPPAVDVTQHPFPVLRQQREGVYTKDSQIDGVSRLYAFRSMPDHQLMVVAGMDDLRVLAEWRQRTLRNGVFFSAALMAILALSALALRSAAAESGALALQKAKSRELEAALADKDVLFQEIHHRVKNNLQIVASMLTMQALQMRDEAVRAALQDALDRIHSMGLVHQTLYTRNEAARVAVGTYLRTLVESLGNTYGAEERGIGVTISAGEDTLDLERAVPLALLANEAVSNALKHAYPQGGGTISLEFRRTGADWDFQVTDDGIGLSSPTGRAGGIGLTLISALARQLGGKARIEGAEGAGTRVALSFPA